MIVAEYKCGYCKDTFRLSYFNSQEIPEKNVGCTTCRIAGERVVLVKKIRDERNWKQAQKSNLDYPIAVLEAERDDVHCPLKSQVDQLQEAIDILIGVKYKRVKEEFNVAAKKIAEAELKKKEEAGVVDKHLFKK